jgi:hypothetical protein
MAHIYDLRGTHGSGKSHVVHELLRRHDSTYLEILHESNHVGHYCAGLALAVVGKYDRVCGGCDGIKTQEEVCGRVISFSQRYQRVLLEGILVGHTYTRYANLASNLQAEGHTYTFMFLDTPLRNCIARVVARRRARGNLKPLDPANIMKDHHTIHYKLYARFKANGYRVVRVPWQESVSAVEHVITQGAI